MTNQETIANLNMIRVGFVDPATKEQMKLIYDTFDNAIQALEQEPCEDAISRQAVLDLIEHYNSDGLGSVFYGYEEGVKFANAVNKLSSVNPQEPKTGHWISIERKPLETPRFECSECHTQEFVETCMYKPIWNYCPNCGCRMVEPQKSEEI